LERPQLLGSLNRKKAINARIFSINILSFFNHGSKVKTGVIMPEKLHCDACNIDFKTKEEMMKHAQEVHPEMEKKD
jgi:hypothetical protein